MSMDQTQLATFEAKIKASNPPAPRVSVQDIKDEIVNVDYVTYKSDKGKVLRWCVIELKNGWVATGDPSASASIENDNEERGKEVAYNNAFNEIWPVMGYALAQKRYEQSQAVGDAAQ